MSPGVGLAASRGVGGCGGLEVDVCGLEKKWEGEVNLFGNVSGLGVGYKGHLFGQFALV